MPTGRYLAQGPEAEFEPGSRGRVLRNLQRIRSARAMADAESQALLAVQRFALGHFDVAHRFTADDVRLLHHQWLGQIYPGRASIGKSIWSRTVSCLPLRSRCRA